MSLEILSGSANPVLAEKIAKLLGVKLAPQTAFHRLVDYKPDAPKTTERQTTFRNSACSLSAAATSCTF
jgi:hypothetical protein